MKIETYEDYHVAQKQSFHATDDVMKAQGIYGVAITEISNQEFLEKIFRYIPTKKHYLCSSLVQWDYACVSNFAFHNGTKF